MKSDITSCSFDSKVLRSEVCVCCGAGEVVGKGEEERYIGEDNVKLYSLNLERLGLSLVWVLQDNWREG